MYYRRPIVDPYYADELRVYRYYYREPYPPCARYYGTPGFGYVEGPYGQREVQAGPYRVYWNR